MDLNGFLCFNTDARLREVVVLEGERAGQIIPRGIVPPGDAHTMVNPPVNVGDWIIPLKIFESRILVQQVRRFQVGKPVTDTLLAQRWIKVESNVSENEGFLEWSLRLRNTLLMEGLAFQSSRRMWGDEFRKVLDSSGIEHPPVHTIVHCNYMIRWGTNARDRLLRPEVDQILAEGEHELVLARVKVSGNVRLMNADPGCQCREWRERGVIVGTRTLDALSSGGRAVFDALSARVPNRTEISDITVAQVSCAYCT